MSIVKTKALTLKDMKPGEPFQIPGNGDCVYVVASGPNVRGKVNAQEVPVVLVIDPDQYETQGSYQHAGHMYWAQASKSVRPVRMVRTPEYEVAG
jgi:hypothetical protein